MHNAQCTIGEWAWEGPALSGPETVGLEWNVTGTSHACGRDEARSSRGVCNAWKTNDFE